MMFHWTESKFLGLAKEQQHKKASEILREIHHGRMDLSEIYQKMSLWLALSPIKNFSAQELSDRFHFHLKEAHVSWQEHNLLTIRTTDTQSTTPFLPIAIYLDNLRSAFNVGSILRTTEAFRLGEIYFSSSTPFIDNPKVQKTSMGTSDKVPCHKVLSLEGLPRPFIALETADFAPSIGSFSFPASFTLLLGNEEYGLSEQVLQQVDQFVQIPLLGNKNSLNVASAFAIAASAIRNNN